MNGAVNIDIDGKSAAPAWCSSINVVINPCGKLDLNFVNI